MLPSLARAHTTRQGWERKLYWWINGVLIFLSDLHKELIVQAGVGGQNSPVIGQQSMKASLPAYSRDDNTSFLKGRWREVRIMPLCRAQFDSTCKICLDHKSNCAILSDRDLLLGVTWQTGRGCPGWREFGLYTQAGETCCGCKCFTPGCRVRLVWSWSSLNIGTWPSCQSWVCVQRQSMRDKGILVFSN